ncbi:MAG: DUF1565 domain-containing protein, partial [Bacteroidetes bacterium]|nr:DUF1565 domain-containing protein [Bacteroidota bacterium]
SALDTLKLNYHIAGKFIYVREDGTSTAPGGTAALPLDTIQAAIDKANRYDAVIVGGGTYSAASTVVTLSEGVSLYGGYAYYDWSIRNPSTYTTTIEHTGTSSSAYAITGSGSITRETVIDGFTIKAANIDNSTAIFNNGSSPTIRNNTIIGGSSTNSAKYCIRNESSASPLVEGNTIISGSTSGSASYICYGIYHDSTGPLVVRNNILTGDLSNTTHSSCSIRNTASLSVTIRNNTFYGIANYSNNSNLGFAITNNQYTGTVTIENNIILSHPGVQICAIWQTESSIQVPVISIRNNNFYTFGDNSNWKLYQASTASGNTYSSINEMETHINSLSGSIAGNNISVNPNFVDIDGFDNDITTIGNNDWTLSAESDSRLREGGLNGAHPNEEWEYVFDIDNNFRSPLDSSTTGWSMGAY